MPSRSWRIAILALCLAAPASAAINNPDNFAFPLLHSQGMYAANGYVNPEADRLVEEARSAASDEKRARLYERLQAIVDRHEPFVTITESKSIRAQRSRVRGFRFRPIFPEEPWDSYYYELSKGP